MPVDPLPAEVKSRKKQLIDLSGQTFGRLKVIERHPANTHAGKACWACICACGSTTVVTGGHLRSGHTQSCGFLFIETKTNEHTLTALSVGRYKHGRAVRGRQLMPEYSCWRNMKTRCLNQAVKNYIDYGGRGITVCDEWITSFETFLADVGFKPSPELTLDRIDNNQGYRPGNVRWATRSQQNRNRRRRSQIQRDRKKCTDYAD